MKKKIGIIGSGMVAQTLGTGFIKHGYEVMMGSRETGKLSDWKSKNPSANLGSFAEAAQYGEIVVLAVGGRVAKSVLDLIGASNLNGKTVIDVTNPIAQEAPENGVIKFFTNLDESLMEQLQDHVPQAHFVKAFNSVGNALMVDPTFETKPSMFICGNDTNAKQEVSDILETFGWEVEDMGGVEGARAIEPLCMLWCIPGMLHGQWSHAFKLLK